LRLKLSTIVLNEGCFVIVAIDDDFLDPIYMPNNIKSPYGPPSGDGIRRAVHLLRERPFPVVNSLA
jgi:hypothetical protein